MSLPLDKINKVEYNMKQWQNGSSTTSPVTTDRRGTSGG